MAHAINTLENTLRRIVLVMAVAALLFPIAAWADIVVLDDGTLTLTVQQGVTSRQNLAASGPGFSAFGSGHLGFVASGCQPCPPGSVYSPGAGGSGAESGFVTYAGVGYTVTELGAICTQFIPGNTAFLSWSAGGTTWA